MTIGLDILHSEGVLLCADSQMEAYATKYTDPKIGVFQTDFAKVAFAVAGNYDYAQAAIQSLAVALPGVRETQAFFETMRRSLEDEYTRLILPHPDRANIDYSLLLGVWHRVNDYPPTEKGKCWLYATNQSSFRSVAIHATIGVGCTLAEQTLRQLYEPGDEIDEIRAKILAAHVIERVKEGSVSCGGVTQILNISDRGEVAFMNPHEVKKVAGGTVLAENEFRSIVLDFADAGIDDEVLSTRIGRIRDRVLAERGKYAVLSSTAKRVHQSTKHDPSIQPPSPE